jgi:hypothetical protein
MLKILKRLRVLFHLELSKYKQFRFIQFFSRHSGDRGFLARLPFGFVFDVILDFYDFGESHSWITFLLSTSVYESKDPRRSALGGDSMMRCVRCYIPSVYLLRWLEKHLLFYQSLLVGFLVGFLSFSSGEFSHSLSPSFNQARPFHYSCDSTSAYAGTPRVAFEK